jgi:hypothetical protein
MGLTVGEVPTRVDTEPLSSVGYDVGRWSFAGDYVAPGVRGVRPLPCAVAVGPVACRDRAVSGRVAVVTGTGHGIGHCGRAFS